MKTKKLIKTLILLFTITTSAVYGNRIGKTFNVKDYGANGDGVTDNYNALIKVAKAVNANGSGTVYFPAGKYYIAQYNTKNNPVADILFSGCNGLSIIGDKAVISVNGNFFRAADLLVGRLQKSTTEAVIPISISKCQNVTIKGLEINGNINRMTRDPKTTEGSGHLIQLWDCENVNISNVYTHHGQTDGIYIGGIKGCRNVTITNSISSNNGRQGMSITHLYKGLFDNCQFINTGITDGAYTRHAPSAGVDIEPQVIPAGAKMGGIVFRNCTFANNMGAQFMSISPKITANIKLVKCTIKSQTSLSKYTMILAADSLVVDSCDIDCGTKQGSVYASWTGRTGGNVEIKNSTIRSAFRGIVSANQANMFNKVKISNNDIICTSKSPSKAYFPYLTSKDLIFENNRVQIPSAVSGVVTPLINNAARSQKNTFSTDKFGIKPKVSYTGTKLIAD
ncbi:MULTISPECIES: glycosyl hydrolase family 28-related protein [unclassified Mucilaginibacter]|uniref:glycosyl hydrolase family 28-related protein n=1 Tax=unclassified Mucilaginibacter TaxID=2617802 RepID=UPI003394B0E4